MTKRIERAKINRDLKVPSIDRFDGSTDPADFIHVFNRRMTFYGQSDIAKFQYFPTCLKGPTLMWYNNLPTRSIDSWSVLKNKFKVRFSTNKKGRKMTASLVNIRQRSNKCLREYLNRFRAETIQISDLIENLAITYLAVGVDKNRHNLLLEEFFEKASMYQQCSIFIIYYTRIRSLVSRMNLQIRISDLKTS